MISDFGNNWGIVVGAEIAGWRTLHEVVALSFIDEEFVGSRDVVCAPRSAGRAGVHAGKCARRGRPLRAGDVITTGMITGVHDIRLGQQSRHVFEGFGEVSCRAVRAKPCRPE